MINKKNLEEKVDEILAYQKKAAHWAMVRTVLSLIFFFLFVILPIVLSYYLIDYIQGSLPQLQQAFGGAEQSAGQLNKITEMLKLYGL